VAYFLQTSNNTLDACNKSQGVWNSVREICQTPTKEVIFQSLSKPHPVSLNNPISHSAVLLNHAEQVGDVIYFRGQSHQSETLYLTMSQLTLLDDSLDGLTYFIAPFTVKSADNSASVYAGLFSYDFKKSEAKHLSSMLLGKEIQETAITLIQKSVVQQGVFVQEGLVKFTFKSHTSAQLASDYPSQKNEVLVQLVGLDPANEAQAAFRLIVKGDSSWEHDGGDMKNLEAINQCDPSLHSSQSQKMAG